VKPFLYQAECLNEIDWFEGRSLVALEPGLGKTLLSLWWMLRHPGAFPAVVVCPASVKFVWEDEAAKVGIRARVLSGQTPRGRPSGKLIVINYDILRHWLPWLKRLKVQTVVLDECHLAANRTKRTAAVRKLCKGVPYVLALSGTPLVNRPIEMHTVLSILRPDEFGSRLIYANRYCDPQWTPYGRTYKGATNTTELHGRLASTCMVRRRKVDVLKDLPAKIRQVVPLLLSNQAEYDRAEEDFLGWLESVDEAKAQSAARAEAVVKVGYLLRLAARLKVPAVIGWIEDKLAEDDEKLLVFCRHRDVLDALRNHFSSQSVVIDGSVPSEKRKGIVEQFQKRDTIRICFANLQAAGTGLDGFQQVPGPVVFAEMGWTPGGMAQAEDRRHRIGAQGTVWCHYLVARGTVEDRLCKILREKQNVLDQVLDGGIIDGGLSVFDELIKGERR
jgi:SWI/SNF-related matrix-associated actin-dependent regulator 1 of chromatin subfamily A